MEGITLEALTNKISLKSQEMMKDLHKGRIEHAENIAQEIEHAIYHYRKLSEELATSTIS
jgi:predicted translin family RNA/ssDNA-binding protein